MCRGARFCLNRMQTVAKLASSASADCICIDAHFSSPSPASSAGSAETRSLCVAGSSQDCVACHSHVILSSFPGQRICVDDYFQVLPQLPAHHSLAPSHCKLNYLDGFLHAQLDSGTCAKTVVQWILGQLPALCQHLPQMQWRRALSLFFLRHSESRLGADK